MKIVSKLTSYSNKGWFLCLAKQKMIFLTLLTLVACQSSSVKTETPTPTPSPDLESRLTLNNATLEQSNIKGELLWKIQVEEATSSADQEIAHLKNIKGNIFQEGKIVLQISANKGQINRNGENILLKENIVAVDPRNKAIIRSEEVEWQPSAGLLIVKQPLKGSDPKVEVSANSGVYDARQQHLAIVGNIVATSKDPKLQLKTENLVWQVPNQMIIVDKPVKIARFEGKTITDDIKADQAVVQMKTHTVTAQKNIEYNSVDPPLQIASHLIQWQYKDRYVSTNQPIQLLHLPEQVTLTGNQGIANLNVQLIHLYGGIRGNSPKDGGKLYADTLSYDIPNKGIAAIGNVIYEKAKPPFNLTGIQAYGLIQDQKITNLVVTGNPQDRVVTEIFPE